MSRRARVGWAAGLQTTILPGRSLRSIWDSSVWDDPADRWALSCLMCRPGMPPTWPVSLGDQVALTGDFLRVLKDGRDSLQVYDTAVDPAEVNQLDRIPAQLRGEADSLLGVVRARNVSMRGHRS